ncbi:MAG: hypothetical protein IJV65_08860 [Kiritimatiellae bacterium]|nr:hypothetical protein [Kiritimatiellia bacterium]
MKPSPTSGETNLAERAAILTALDDPAANLPLAVDLGLTGDDFADKPAGRAFDTMLAMYEGGEAVDAVTVATRLEECGDAAARVVLQRAFDISIASTSNFEQHVRDILTQSTRRRVASLALHLATEAGAAGADARELAGKAAQELAALASSGKREPSTADVVDSIAQEWEDLADGKREIGGAELPTDGMTRLLDRLKPGLHVLAGKTSTGKSIVEGAIVRNLALNGGVVLRCFLDLGRRALLQRDLAALCFLDLRELDHGHLHPDERHVLRLARSAWRKDIAVESLVAPTASEIVAKVRAMKAARGRVDLVTVDFIQQVNTGNAKTDGSGNANARIGEITRALKNYAIDAEVPFLLLSQLNRNQKDEASTPDLTDLRDSGNIEQDARSVCFLHPNTAVAQTWIDRKGVLNGPEDGAQTWRDLKMRPIFLSVAKNQQGRRGCVSLRMQCNYFAIEDAVKDPVTGVPDFDHTPTSATSAPVPVIARDSDGRLAAFDPRFLPLINRAAKRNGLAQFSVVERVDGGLECVADRLAKWRAST